MKAVYKMLWVMVAITGLAGCAHNVKTTTTIAGSDHYLIESSLSASAQSASMALNALASLAKSQYQDQHGHGPIKPIGQVHDPALLKSISTQWYGPIAPLLEEIAQKTGYRMQVYGKAPTIPILVQLDTVSQPKSAIDAVRDINDQAGTNAQVQILSKQRIISLRYAS